MNLVRIKFRPSSHSEDGTVVATFNDETEARHAAKKLGNYARHKRVGCMVRVHCHGGNHGTLRKASNIFYRAGAKTVEHFDDNYQELTIEITLPKGATLETFIFLADADTANIIRQLTKTCPPPKQTLGKTTKITFNYKGKQIYLKKGYRWEKAPYGLFLLGNHRISLTKTFKFKGLV